MTVMPRAAVEAVASELARLGIATHAIGFTLAQTLVEAAQPAMLATARVELNREVESLRSTWITQSPQGAPPAPAQPATPATPDTEATEATEDGTDDLSALCDRIAGAIRKAVRVSPGSKLRRLLADNPNSTLVISEAEARDAAHAVMPIVLAERERAETAERELETAKVAFEAGIKSTAADALAHRLCSLTLGKAEARAEQADAAAQRVRDLHRKFTCGCGQDHGIGCNECRGEAWPCDTITALDRTPPDATGPARTDPDEPRCGESATLTGTRIGPCIRHAGHTDPEHWAADGTTWKRRTPPDDGRG